QVSKQQSVFGKLTKRFDIDPPHGGSVWPVPTAETTGARGSGRCLEGEAPGAVRGGGRPESAQPVTRDPAASLVTIQARGRTRSKAGRALATAGLRARQDRQLPLHGHAVCRRNHAPAVDQRAQKLLAGREGRARSPVSHDGRGKLSEELGPD